MLDPINTDIDARVEAIRTQYADWPCRLGCAGCCRSLAEIPRLTPPEWVMLRAGLAQLPADQLRAIAEAVAALRVHSARPVVCPMLDPAAGACRVYAHRPVACRTYGYYVQRGLGVYCKDLEAQVASGMRADVVWGNQDAVDLRLAECGEPRELTDWFQDWDRAEIAEPFAAPG